jgi:hypothetical protein
VSAKLQTDSGRVLSVEGIVQWNTASVLSKRLEPGFGIRVTGVRSDYLAFVEGALAAGPLDDEPGAQTIG